MSFRNISLVPLKMSSITPLGLKDWRTIFGQACFCFIPEFWTLLWLCHAVTFCCFLDILDGNTMKYYVLRSQNIQHWCPESIEPSFVKIRQVYQNLTVKNWLGNVFWKRGNLECHTPIKEAFSLQQEYWDIRNRFLLHCYHIEFT
jgi:hypothetical protein